MTLELNVYSICKQPNIDYDEVKGVNSTEEIHEAGDVISLCISDLLEFVLIMIDSFLGRHNFDDDTQILKCLNGALCSHIVWWMPKKEVYEELPTQKKKLIPSNIQWYGTTCLYTSYYFGRYY